jgi:acylphosphatase
MIVSGRVQGVGFRWFVRDAARARGLSGWARNRRDGTVEVEVAGPRTQVEEFARALRQGPPASSVKDVSIQWLPMAVDAGDDGSPLFDIRPTA